MRSEYQVLEVDQQRELIAPGPRVVALSPECAAVTGLGVARHPHALRVGLHIRILSIARLIA